MSKQRQMILETLQQIKSHPTADELYIIVKKSIPNISLGTVYRNLNQLAEAGEILKLEYAGVQKRFDGSIYPHDHFRCNSCGKIFDVPHVKISSVKKLMEGLKDCQLMGYHMELFGLCACCTQQKFVTKES